MHQLTQLNDLVGAEGVTVESVAELGKFFATKDRVILVLFSEVVKFVALCLCQPCSNASSERAFSSLRHLKTWCRSTMEQARLTHLGLMTVHRGVVMGLHRTALMQTFIDRTPERRSVFGKF